MKKFFYAYLCAFFLSISTFQYSFGMEENTNLPIQTYTESPAGHGTIDFVYADNMAPQIPRIVDFDNADNLPDTIFISLRNTNTQSTDKRTLIRNQVNRNQYFSLDDDEMGDLSVGKTPTDLLPYTNSKKSQLIKPTQSITSSKQHELEFRNLAFTSKESLKGMQGEIAAYHRLCNRYAYVPKLIPANEILVMVADDCDDEDALKEIADLCTKKNLKHLYNDAIITLRQDDELLRFDKARWPKTRYIPKHERPVKITGEKIQELKSLSSIKYDQLEAIKNKHLKSIFIQKMVHRIEGHLKDQKPINELAYLLIDALHSIPSTDEHTERDNIIIEGYNAFFDANTGLPSFFNYNEGLGRILFPGDMGQADNDLRKLMFDLGILKESNIVIQQEGLLKTAVREATCCISSANVVPHNAKQYTMIAHSIYKALTDTAASKTILSCHTFDDTIISEEKAYLHQMTLDYVYEILKELERKDLSISKQETLEKSLLTLDCLWQRTQNNVRDAKALLSCISEIEHIAQIANKLEKTDEEFAHFVNRKGQPYELEYVNPRARPDTHQNDKQIIQEVETITHESSDVSESTLKLFKSLELPHIKEFNLVHDLALSSSQFGILSYEFQKQGYLELAKLSENVGLGLFTAGKIIAQEAVNTVQGMAQTAFKAGKFATTAVTSPRAALAITEEALGKASQAIEFTLIAFGKLLEAMVSPDDRFLKQTFDAVYEYAANLSGEDIFRLGVQFTINPWIRTKILGTFPLCFKAVNSLTSQAGKIQRVQKGATKAGAIRSKLVKERKLLRLYKKNAKSAKSGQGKSLAVATQKIIQTLIKEKKALLKLQYPQAVKEAWKVLNLKHAAVVAKIKKPHKVLEEITKDIAKIDSKKRWKALRFDPAHNGQCLLKNVREALAGIACEEQGLLKELKRNIKPIGGDFVDKLGRAWDVKTPISYALNGKKIFNTEKGILELTTVVKKELNRNINVIIDTYYLQASDHPILLDLIKNNFSTIQQGKIIILKR